MRVRVNYPYGWIVSYPGDTGRLPGRTENGKSWLPFVQLRGKHVRLPKREKCRLSYKSSSKFFSSAKRELEIFIVLGGKANERAGALRALAYYRDRKREAKDFEKV